MASNIKLSTLRAVFRTLQILPLFVLFLKGMLCLMVILNIINLQFGLSSIVCIYIYIRLYLVTKKLPTATHSKMGYLFLGLCSIFESLNLFVPYPEFILKGYSFTVLLFTFIILNAFIFFLYKSYEKQK